MIRISIQLNKPDEGDDPENRYDCDNCMYAPAEHELILVIEDVPLNIESCRDILYKYCLACAFEHLTSQELWDITEQIRFWLAAKTIVNGWMTPDEG